MRIHQIRYSTLRIDFNGKTFLVNPMFSPRGEILPMKDRQVSYDLPLPLKDIIKNIDAVILTNLHPDRFDKYAEDILPKSTKIFVQDIFDKNALEKSHFDNIEVLNADGTDFDGVKLYKTECMHGVREKAEPVFLANGMRWEAMGVVFKSDNEPTLYHTGDTLWFYGVQNAIDLFKPDYIIANHSIEMIGKGIPINMSVEDIKSLYEYSTQSQIIINNVDNNENKTKLKEELKIHNIDQIIHLPANGELMIFEKKVE